MGGQRGIKRLYIISYSFNPKYKKNYETKIYNYYSFLLLLQN